MSEMTLLMGVLAMTLSMRTLATIPFDGGPGDDILDGGDGTDACTNGETHLSCERPPPNSQGSTHNLSHHLVSHARYPYWSGVQELPERMESCCSGNRRLEVGEGNRGGRKGRGPRDVVA